MKACRTWIVGVVAAALMACGPEMSNDEGLTVPPAGDELMASTQDITDVDHTPVKRQSIGNCWLYATASWAEALSKTHTGVTENMSESYWTYWHWFEQIANGRARTEISTGGSWGVGVDLIRRYGVMAEGAFIPSESNDEMSLVQKSALAAINASLKDGELSTPEARRDRALVRRELDRAWGLSSTVVAELDRVFGESVTTTLDRNQTLDLSGSKVRRSSDFPIAEDTSVTPPVTVTLADAIGTRFGSTNPDSRQGKYAWREFNYSSSPTARRSLQQRVQKALHAGQPVVITWFVDFNSLDNTGAFKAPPAKVGRQGGHVTVLEDYEIENVPGFGTLKAGELETRPDALQAALDPTASIKFFRTKNSWGTFRPDRQFIVPGYHDLYTEYLNGPLEQCVERAAEPANVEEDARECIRSVPHTPLWGFVLPPGI